MELQEAPAIRDLGSLFKLTEVYLWEYAPTEVREVPVFPESAKLMERDDDDNGPNDASIIREDMELTRQMDDLGLPFAFHTNKEKRKGSVKGKKKEKVKSSIHKLDLFDDGPQNAGKVIEGVYAVPAFSDYPGDSLCSNSMAGESEVLNGEIADDVDGLGCQSGGGEEPMCLITPDACDFTCSYKTHNNELQYDIDSQYGYLKTLPDAETAMQFTPGIEDLNSSGSCLVNDVCGNGREEVNGERVESASLESSSAADDGTHEPFYNDVSMELMPDSSVASLQFSEVIPYDTANNERGGVLGDWREYWDDFYRRNYFYNVATHECTWEPPPGLENLALSDVATEPAKAVVEISELEYSNVDFGQSSHSLQPNFDLGGDSRICDRSEENQVNGTLGDDQVADNFCKATSRKRTKKARRRKSCLNFPLENEDLKNEGFLNECSPRVDKYWCQRYLLFSRFDDGIQMDEEGWFSVTPELIAKHHADRCGTGVIVDCFTGVGGNAIQFAQRSKHVIAVDIDPKKIDYAKHNAAIYGVDDCIDFIRADSILLMPKLKVDTVFMSPPWGGPSYAKVKKFDVKTMLKPCDGPFLFNLAKTIAKRIVMFLPRNVDVNQLAEMSLSANPPWSLEVEKNFLNGKLKAITAYFNEPSV